MKTPTHNAQFGGDFFVLQGKTNTRCGSHLQLVTLHGWFTTHIEQDN